MLLLSDSLQTPEVWKPIPDWTGYDASNFGQVRSWLVPGPGFQLYDEPHLLVPAFGGGGYLVVSLMRDGRSYTQYVAALVLSTFVGPRPAGMQSAHGNGNKFDNTLENLRWATPKSNYADRYAHGTVLFGEKNPCVKLTEAEVLEILASNEPLSVLVDRYPVSRSRIKQIRARKAWRHLEAA